MRSIKVGEVETFAMTDSVPALLAAVFFALLGRFTKRSVRNLRVLAAVVISGDDTKALWRYRDRLR